MANMTIQLDPVALREATAQAIMGTLTPEVRDNVLRGAISNLLSPSTDSWDRGQSPLTKAFSQAVEQVAHQLAREHVQNDPAIMDHLRGLVRTTGEKLLTQDVNKLAEKMADAFVNSIRSER